MNLFKKSNTDFGKEKPSMLLWLLLIGYCANLIHYWNKKSLFIFSEFINPIHLPHVLFIIITVASNVGLFISLYSFFKDTKNRRMAGGIALGFLLLWITTTSRYCIGAYVFFETEDEILSIQQGDRNLLPLTIHVLYQTTPHESQEISSLLYSQYGFELPYKNEKQTLVPFVPSPDVIKERAKSVELNKMSVKIEKTSQSLFHESSLLLATHLLCFVTVFTFGVLYLIFKAPKESKSDESPLASS